MSSKLEYPNSLYSDFANLISYCAREVSSSPVKYLRINQIILKI